MTQPHSDQTAALLAQLLHDTAEVYANDPSRAGVLLSSLGRGEYYGSIVRFKKPYGQDREVVCKAKSQMLEGVLISLTEQWLVDVEDEEVVRYLTGLASQLKESMIDG
jgi:hypothetical protein